MTPAETAEDRDARLEKAALERDRAVALLRAWLDDLCPDVDNCGKWMHKRTRKFLESLT